MASAVVAVPPPRRGTVRLAWCMLPVACVHALVLLGWLGGAALASPPGGTPRAVQLRLIGEASIQPTASRPSKSDTGRSPPRLIDFQPGAMWPHALATGDADDGASPQVAASAELPPFATQVNATEGNYLPRSALSAGPRPLDPVVIAYPSFDGEASRYAAEFDVFIDDRGSVVRVDGRDSGLPRILLDAVRQAFHTARFAPGELDGRPVHSRIRIEVTFDSTGGDS